MWPHLPLEEKPSCWISWVYRGANITNILCLFHTANVSILCLLTVRSLPLFLGGIRTIPMRSMGCPRQSGLKCESLSPLKSSLLPGLTHGPQPHSHLGSLKRRWVHLGQHIIQTQQPCSPWVPSAPYEHHTTVGAHTARNRVRGTSASECVKAVDWGTKLLWQTLKQILAITRFRPKLTT